MTAQEYRENAEECIGWARTARSDREREIFLQMARTWLGAAEQLEAAEREAGRLDTGQSLFLSRGS